MTLKGNVLCARATTEKDWNWDTSDGDHTPIVYAFEGTPEIATELDKIMKTYPKRGLNTDDAIRIQNEFTKNLTYALTPNPAAASIHKQVEAGTQWFALTGTIQEKDGKKTFTVTSFTPTQANYPALMRAPDRPFALPDLTPIFIPITDDLKITCITLPAGRFLQGSPFYQKRYQDEFPHEVVITKPFAMSETPITQEVFQAVMHKNPSLSKGPRFPVDTVPRADIEEFCRILSSKTGKTVRLPTDAEWEYAARVGTSNPCLSDKYQSQISETSARPGKTPVRTKQPNAWGLYDMLSAGWHITRDFKSDNVRTKQIDPEGPAATDKRVHGDANGKLFKTRGGPHYDHIRPNIHGAATKNGTLWEGGAQIFRIVVETAVHPVPAASR